MALIAGATEKEKRWPDNLMAKEMKLARQPIEWDGLAHRSTASLLVLGRLHETSQDRRLEGGHLNRGDWILLRGIPATLALRFFDGVFGVFIDGLG